VLYLAGIAVGVQLMHTEFTASNNAITLNFNPIKPWWSAFFAITAAQNILTTCKFIIWHSPHRLLTFVM
jgi:hypothetical protein